MYISLFCVIFIDMVNFKPFIFEICRFFLTLILMGRGGFDSVNLFEECFTFKTRYFQGCLRLWSRGHQVCRHPCKLGNLAIFYHAKNVFPIKYKGKKYPIKSKVLRKQNSSMDLFALYSLIHGVAIYYTALHNKFY